MMRNNNKTKWDILALDIETVIEEAFDKLQSLSEDVVNRRPTPSDWSAKEVIGHLIDSASNNHQRFVRLQITDGLTFPDYQHDNDAWVRIQKYHETSWDELLDLWQCLNRHLARIIKNVNETCIDHIWVVDEDNTITLGELMVDYLRHLRVHVVQIEDCVGGFAKTKGSGISFSDIEDAFFYVSSTTMSTNHAILCKETGEIYYASEFGDMGDEIPEEVYENDNCIEIPHKNELDLGRNLIFEFVEEHLPADFEQVKNIFRRRGAYGRYKDLLDERGVMQKWYDFENARQTATLKEWCKDNGIELDG